MLRFFRQIRQSLIMNDNTRKYIWYALGEIFLVMIGILLALQVNNWNQDRIESEQQDKMVQKLYDEFESNYEELLVDIDRLKDSVEALDTLISVMDSPNPPDFDDEEMDRIITSTGNDPTWNPSSFVLADLKSNGQISSLKNEELVNLIFSWERFYENLLEYQVNFSNATYDHLDYLTEVGIIVNINNILNITSAQSTVSSLTVINNDKKLYYLSHRKLIHAHLLLLRYEETAEKLIEIINVAKL